MANIFALQPYAVGSKNGKSVAIVISAKIVRKYKIDTSTIFALKGNENKRGITLRAVHGIEEEDPSNGRLDESQRS